MGSIKPNMNQRGPELPPGCKDLIDVLKPDIKEESHPISTEHFFVNGEIRAKEVWVYEESGIVVGLFTRAEAIHLAKGRNIDLVQVDARVLPPICVLTDYGKYRYQQSKRRRKKVV